MDEPDGAVALLKILVGAFFYPARDVCLRRAARGRIVLEAAVARGIVRGGDDDAVRKAALAPGVPTQDGVRHGRRGRIGAILGNTHVDAIGHQHLKRRAEGGLGKRVRVATEKERAVNALGAAIIAHRLSDGVDMLFVEGMEQRRAPVPRGADRNALPRNLGVGKFRIIGAHERGDALKCFGRGQVSGIAMHNRHRPPPAKMLRG